MATLSGRRRRLGKVLHWICVRVKVPKSAVGLSLAIRFALVKSG